MTNITVLSNIPVDILPATGPSTIVYDGGNPVQVIAGTPPVVTPPSAIPTLNYEPQDLANLIALDGWCGDSSSYERLQKITVLTGDSATLGFGVKKTTTRKLLAPTYMLYVYAMPANKFVQAIGCAVPPNSSKASFDLPLADMPEGWYRLKIMPASSPETAPSWFAYRYIDGSTKPALMPVCTGSYEVMHDGKTHAWAMVPATFAPTPRPLAPRVHEPFATALPYTQLYREYLVPARTNNINRPNVDPHGILCTFNYQAYHWSNLIHKWPRVSLLDGPRGVGCTEMVTHIGTPEPDGSVYFLDPWRLGEISVDGTITTLCGYRHRQPPAHWNETNGPADVELVGDWSAVAVKGFHEAWEYVKDGDYVYITDSQNNRVIRFLDDDSTRVVTEFITGLKDPWGIRLIAGQLFISERTADRISVWDARTPQTFIRTLIAATTPGLATVTVDRFVIRNAPLATIQAQPCVAPEGLFDIGDGFLSFGSQAMGQIRRVNIATGVVSVAATPRIDNNTHFVKIAMSDGSFGPLGSYFASTWSNTNLGMPEAFTPDGKRWEINRGAIGSPSQGRGGQWESLGYASAVGCGNGRLLCASSAEGIAVLSKAQATDPAPNYALYAKGEAAFNAGLQLIYGDRGFGYWGFPPPAGQSPELDYFLEVNK